MERRDIFPRSLQYLIAIAEYGSYTRAAEALYVSQPTLSQQIKQLEGQVDNLQSTNAGLLDRMADLSIVSKTGAESIKKSLENMTQQYGFIQDLTKKIQSKTWIIFSVTSCNRAILVVQSRRFIKRIAIIQSLK